MGDICQNLLYFRVELGFVVLLRGRDRRNVAASGRSGRITRFVISCMPFLGGSKYLRVTSFPDLGQASFLSYLLFDGLEHIRLPLIMRLLDTTQLMFYNLVPGASLPGSSSSTGPTKLRTHGE